MKEKISWHSNELYKETDVLQFGFDNLNEWLKREKLWVINFYNSENSKSLEVKDDYVKLAHLLKDLVVVSAVDCHFEAQFCQYSKITRYPSYVIYPEKEPSAP